MRRLLVLLVACAPATHEPPAPAAPGPCHDDSVACAMLAMRHYTARICACQDRTCAEHVDGEMTRWGSALPRSPEPPHPAPEEAARAQELMTRYTACRSRLVPSGNP